MEILSTVIASVSIHNGKKGWFSFGENLAYSLTNTDPNQTNTYNDFLRMMLLFLSMMRIIRVGYGYGDAAKYNTLV